MKTSADSHGREQLLASYNSSCPDCRRVVTGLSVITALQWLSDEVVAARRTGGTLRLANAIAIYQRAVKASRVKGRK